MRRFPIALSLIMVLCGTGESYSKESDLLRNLRCARLQVNIIGGEGLSLPESDVKQRMLVEIRAKLPRLKVLESCPNTLVSYVVAVPIKTTAGLLGSAEVICLELTRPAMVRELGEELSAVVLTMFAYKSGPVEDLRDDVFDLNENLIAKFAASYYEAGNP